MRSLPLVSLTLAAIGIGMLQSVPAASASAFSSPICDYDVFTTQEGCKVCNRGNQFLHYMNENEACTMADGTAGICGAGACFHGTSITVTPPPPIPDRYDCKIHQICTNKILNMEMLKVGMGTDLRSCDGANRKATPAQSIPAFPADRCQLVGNTSQKGAEWLWKYMYSEGVFDSLFLHLGWTQNEIFVGNPCPIPEDELTDIHDECLPLLNAETDGSDTAVAMNKTAFIQCTSEAVNGKLKQLNKLNALQVKGDLGILGPSPLGSPDNVYALPPVPVSTSPSETSQYKAEKIEPPPPGHAWGVTDVGGGKTLYWDAYNHIYFICGFNSSSSSSAQNSSASSVYSSEYSSSPAAPFSSSAAATSASEMSSSSYDGWSSSSSFPSSYDGYSSYSSSSDSGWYSSSSLSSHDWSSSSSSSSVSPYDMYTSQSSFSSSSYDWYSGYSSSSSGYGWPMWSY